MPWLTEMALIPSNPLTAATLPWVNLNRDLAYVNQAGT